MKTDTRSALLAFIFGIAASASCATGTDTEVFGEAGGGQDLTSGTGGGMATSTVDTSSSQVSSSSVSSSTVSSSSNVSSTSGSTGSGFTGSSGSGFTGSSGSGFTGSSGSGFTGSSGSGFGTCTMSSECGSGECCVAALGCFDEMLVQLFGQTCLP